MARNRRRHRGHYCWCCDRFRPDEQFSGKGHKRHLCRDCARLGREELEYRQALRDMERCVGSGGRVFKKRRTQFDVYLHHENPRIRAAAKEIVGCCDDVQEEWRQMESEYENYDPMEEALQVLEHTQASVNRELTEAAELDKSFSNIDFSF